MSLKDRNVAADFTAATTHGVALGTRYLCLVALTLICLTFGSKPALAILGGTNADWNSYPWLAKNVALYPGQTQWVSTGCSSTLIAPFYAVTAAHCLNGPYPYTPGLMLSDGRVIVVAQEIRHPNYSRDSLHYKFVFGVVSESVADIGLQRLAQPVGLARGEQILDIFNNTDSSGDLVGLTGKVLGWGVTQEQQAFQQPPPFSPTLQQIDEVVQDNGTCQAVLNEVAAILTGGETVQSPFQFNKTLFCATPVGLTLPNFSQLPANPAGVCTGDTGPMFAPNGFLGPQLWGFVTDYLSTSLGTQCGNGVDIYTRITPEYLKWIESVVLPFLGR